MYTAGTFVRVTLRGSYKLRVTFCVHFALTYVSHRAIKRYVNVNRNIIKRTNACAHAISKAHLIDYGPLKFMCVPAYVLL